MWYRQGGVSIMSIMSITTPVDGGAQLKGRERSPDESRGEYRATTSSLAFDWERGGVDWARGGVDWARGGFDWETVAVAARDGDDNGDDDDDDDNSNDSKVFPAGVDNGTNLDHLIGQRVGH